MDVAMICAGERRVAPEEAGERLDCLLHAWLPELSRTTHQRRIRGGCVRVNDGPAPPGMKLQAGDRVTWDAGPLPAHPSAEPEAIPLSVVYQDDHLLVIDKPRGMVVHPSPGHAAGTLVNAVLGLVGGGDEFDDPLRPGIVHRLDRDTSGLMVVARTPQALEALQQQLRTRSMTRAYVALVRGAPSFEQAEVDAPIDRDPRRRQRMAVVEGGRPALTRLRVLERFPGLALVEARLASGRTHQIRVHCAYIGLPVVGDPLYAPLTPIHHPDLPPAAAAAIAALHGQALHAYLLEFVHSVTQQRLHFLAAPPAEFQAILSALGSGWTLAAPIPSVHP